MSTNPPIVAGVLIGGKSRRMGTDKALLPWAHATLLESTVQTARRVAKECVLLGDMERIPDSLRSMRRLPDRYPGIGPIAGLHELLSHGSGEWCLLLSCDIPAITVRTIATLIDHITPATRVIAYSMSPDAQDPEGSNPRDRSPLDSGSHEIRLKRRLETCCALYHSSILPIVTRALANRHHALCDLIESVPHAKILADPAVRRSLRNINAPEDYTG